MNGAEAKYGTHMPPALEELLSDHNKDDDSTNRNISTRIDALKARLKRAGPSLNMDSSPVRAHPFAPSNNLNAQISPVQTRQPYKAETPYNGSTLEAAESSIASPQIPRSSLSEVQCPEELYSARYHAKSGSSNSLEVEMLKRRVVELENEVILLRNENEALRNRLTINCSQNLCRSHANQGISSTTTSAFVPSQPSVASQQQMIKMVTEPSVSNIKPVSLDMSDFERQWQAIEAGVTSCMERTSVSEPSHNSFHTPKAGVIPRHDIENHHMTQAQAPALSASRIYSTPSVWCNDAYKKSKKLNKEIEEALGNAMTSSNIALSMTNRARLDGGAMGEQTPNPYTMTMKVALPTAGNVKEAVAPRLIGIDEEAEEPCIVWRRDTSSGLVPSGALALEHINECIYGEHARTFRGWIIMLRKEGEQRSIAELIDQWSGLSPEQLALLPKSGHQNSIVLVSRTRALCFEIHNADDYAVWVNYLLKKLT